jgi:uncharacterized protein (TIGR03435 family)
MRLISTLVPAWTVLAPVAVGLRAQTVEPRPAFEVVSIKPLEHSVPLQGRPPSDPGRVTYPNATLTNLIMRAYDVKNYQISGLPSPDTKFYNVVAKIPDGASQEQVPAMLQTLLAERFGLKVHWETQTQPVYALIVSKGGPKLKRFDETVPLTGPDGKPISSAFSFSTSGHLEFRRTTMAQFARVLSGQLGRPVLDMTEIDGYFDIVVDANPADLDGLQKLFPDAGNPGQESAAAASIFTAVQALGLKLESRKEPIRHLIVDSALKVPTEN